MKRIIIVFTNEDGVLTWVAEDRLSRLRVHYPNDEDYGRIKVLWNTLRAGRWIILSDGSLAFKEG